MATPVYTEIASGRDGSSSTTFTLDDGGSDFTITAGRPVFVGFSTRNNPTVTSLTGFGLTWQELPDGHGRVLMGNRTLYVWYAQGTPSPATDSLDLTFSGQGRSCCWGIIQGDSNTPSSNPFGDLDSAMDTSMVDQDTLSNTLTGVASDSATLVACGGDDGVTSTAVTPATFTDHTIQAFGDVYFRWHSKANNETSITGTYTIPSGSSRGGMVSIEAKGTGAPPVTGGTPIHYYRRRWIAG